MKSDQGRIEMMSMDMLTTDSVRPCRSAAGPGAAGLLCVLCCLMSSGCAVDGHQAIGAGLFTKPEKTSGAATLQTQPHACPTCSAPLATVDPAAPTTPPVDAIANHSAATAVNPAGQPGAAVPSVPMIPPEQTHIHPPAGFGSPVVSVPAAAGMANQMHDQATQTTPQTQLPYQKAMSLNGVPQQSASSQVQAARTQSAMQSTVPGQTAQASSMGHQPPMHQHMAVTPQPNSGVAHSPQIGNPGAFTEPWCNINNQPTLQNCPPVPQTAAVDDCEDRVAMLERKLESLNTELSRTQGTLEMTVGQLEQTKEATINTENRAMNLERQNRSLMEHFKRMQREQDEQLDLIEEAVKSDPADSSQPVPQASSNRPSRRASPAPARSVSRTRSSAVALPAVEE